MKTKGQGITEEVINEANCVEDATITMEADDFWFPMWCCFVFFVNYYLFVVDT